MTWTKLGQEWPHEAGDLSDAAFRTHVEALAYSNRCLLDLVIRKRELARFAFSESAHSAVIELVTAGWWEDRGDCWYIGLRFPDWQRDRVQVEHRRKQLAEAQVRRRRHLLDDHALCLPQSCRSARPSDESSVESSVDRADDPERNGTAALTTGPPTQVEPTAEREHKNKFGVGHCVSCGSFEKLGDDNLCSVCVIRAKAEVAS